MLHAIRSKDNAETPYERYVNPQWVRLLDILQMNVEYVHCSGAELRLADGCVILDFNPGYCVHNVGHNHPRVIAALKNELDKAGPAMLQNHVAGLAGKLAERLCTLAGGRPDQGLVCKLRQRGHRGCDQIRARACRKARHPVYGRRFPRP